MKYEITVKNNNITFKDYELEVQPIVGFDVEIKVNIYLSGVLLTSRNSIEESFNFIFGREDSDELTNLEKMEQLIKENEKLSKYVFQRLGRRFFFKEFSDQIVLYYDEQEFSILEINCNLNKALDILDVLARFQEELT